MPSSQTHPISWEYKSSTISSASLELILPTITEACIYRQNRSDVALQLRILKKKRPLKIAISKQAKKGNSR